MPSRSDLIERVHEYDGHSEVLRLRATQLGARYSASQARRVLQEWVDFFASGPSTIRDLRLVTRTPARLFDALAGQTQLRSLEVKWGDYSDLRPLERLTSLTSLSLRGASKVSDVSSVGTLTSLRSLVIEGFHVLNDPAPLGQLRDLESLELGGKWTTPRNGHLPSLGFLRSLTALRELLLHTVVVDDKDYTPVLDLQRLEKVRIMATRGMRPSIEDLIASLPWNG